jgi:hypothetical protein
MAVGMANQPQLFRQHLITRALRAATKAGVVNPSCTVQLPDGVTLVIGAAGGTAAGAAGAKVRGGGAAARPSRGPTVRTSVRTFRSPR